VTAAEFRRLALALPEAIESAHMGHPDFRVAGRIFATLGYPGPGWAMIRLEPEDQEVLIRSEPRAFSRVEGAWGRAGATSVQLRAARKVVVREALTLAWRARAPARLVRQVAH
jgi:hypothetical protein